MAWSLIESDPGLFTLLIKDLGVSNVQVEELPSLEEEYLARYRPAYGLVFLFQWKRNEAGKETDRVVPSYEHPHVFFAKQVITNACATQAILSIILNVPEIDVGPQLTDFRDNVKDFPPEMKGLALSNMEFIRRAHNNYARPELFISDEQDNLEANNSIGAYHFIAYVPIDGVLYELDGLKEGPIAHGPCPMSEDWLKTAKPIIKEKMKKTGGTEFSLMLLTENRINQLQRELLTIEERISKTNDLLEKQNLNHRIDNILSSITTEQYNLQLAENENLLRRHNYLPFIIELLKLLIKYNKV